MDDENKEIAKLVRLVNRDLKGREWLGWLSTSLVFIAAPLAALLVESPIGWIIYTVSAIAGIVHFSRKRDRAMAIQFGYYLIMNVIAIVTRVI